MSKMSIKSLGCINLSGKVIVSDPCYQRGTWCMAENVPIRPGRYATYIITSDEGKWGERVAAVIAVHLEHTKPHNAKWTSLGYDIGVDSGQCGIFDDTAYPVLSGESSNESRFYEQCCQITSDGQGGVLNARNGIVSSSGYGDGLYRLFCQHNRRERVALMIDFDLTSKKDLMDALAEHYNEMNKMEDNHE